MSKNKKLNASQIYYLLELLENDYTYADKQKYITRIDEIVEALQGLLENTEDKGQIEYDSKRNAGGT